MPQCTSQPVRTSTALPPSVAARRTRRGRSRGRPPAPRITTASRPASELQRQRRQILPVGVAVERRVEVGAGVRHHLDLADLELDAGRVPPARGLPAQEVADDRPRQAGVGRHAVLDGVAEIDEGHAARAHPVCARSSSATPASAQMRAIVSPTLLFGVEAPAVMPMTRPVAQPAGGGHLVLGADRLVADRPGRRVHAVGVLDVDRCGRPCDCTSAARWQVLLEL